MPNGTCVAGMWEKLERMGTHLGTQHQGETRAGSLLWRRPLRSWAPTNESRKSCKYHWLRFSGFCLTCYMSVLFEKLVMSDESAPSEEYMSQVRGNWLNAGNTQVLINHKLLFECIKSKKLQEKYDLFMFRP